ncbi:hypothetical protein EYF80_033515 [Liparis tanakae]|uniref:Uncharacterized protein n=1 Tax=Liparis tanakae TaxID=230148 RepID=A0A4Z2GSE8_9TELE|nr:hypothetical protein EYF80_033515 [Liparis tanakae]
MHHYHLRPDRRLCPAGTGAPLPPPPRGQPPAQREVWGTADQPSPAPLLPSSTLISSDSLPAPLILAGPLSLPSRHRFAAAETKKAPPTPGTENKRHNSGRKAPRSIFAFVRGETLPTGTDTERVAGAIPSTHSTAKHNNILDFLRMAASFSPSASPVRCVALGLSCGRAAAARPGSAVSVRGASPCGFGELRQSVRGSGGSRKHPANIGGVRGQRLPDSNPIKRRLRQPWRRAGADSESSRAVRFRAKAEARGWGQSQ